VWNLAVAALVIWAERRFALRGGRAFALYVAAYTVGRAWIEALRVDHANHILGLRLNDWTSLIIFLAAVLYLWRGPHGHPGSPAPRGSLDDVGHRPSTAAGDVDGPS
jgi:prolipoprotein diacylglyceryltransferase